MVVMLGRLTLGLMVFAFRLTSALAVLFLFTMLQEPPKSEASDTSRFVAASLGNHIGASGDALSHLSTDGANSSRETQGHAEEIETVQWTTSPEPQASEAPAAAVPPARSGLTPAEATAYTTLARAKIQQGDIAAARRLLERAADGDDADALLALAETYDPRMLAQWGVIGVKPNVELAKTLYNKAGIRGAKRARERLLAIQK
jgi:TPR repeat protein